MAERLSQARLIVLPRVDRPRISTAYAYPYFDSEVGKGVDEVVKAPDSRNWSMGYKLDSGIVKVNRDYDGVADIDAERIALG